MKWRGTFALMLGDDRSTIEVDTKDYQHPVVKVEVMIDGKPAYQ